MPVKEAGEEMVDRDIAYIKTEPISPRTPCRYVKGPNYRCTIEFQDGTTIIRCGVTAQHALANAIAYYKINFRNKE